MSTESLFNDAVERQDIIAKLVDVRAQTGLTVADIATELSTSSRAIAELEAHDDDPSVGTLQAYARAVGARLQLDITTGTKT